MDYIQNHDNDVTENPKGTLWQRTLKKVTHFEKHLQRALNLDPN